MTKTLAIISDGSKPLKNNMHERYAKFRAQALPRIVAFRKAGCVARNDHVADTNSFRLERKPGVRERIEYLSSLAQDRVAEKRVALEEQLWAVAEADIGAFWETYEVAKTGTDGKLAPDQNGKMLTNRKQRAKLINDLPLEFRKLIEDVTIDRNGNVVPKLYNKLQANAELRKMLNIGSQTDRPESDVSRLSDAELIQQLADQAKELGVDIKLDYTFAQLPPATETAAARLALQPPTLPTLPPLPPPPRSRLRRPSLQVLALLGRQGLKTGEACPRLRAAEVSESVRCQLGISGVNDSGSPRSIAREVHSLICGGWVWCLLSRIAARRPIWLIYPPLVSASKWLPPEVAERFSAQFRIAGGVLDVAVAEP
jgi:hypothetical protein